MLETLTTKVTSIIKRSPHAWYLTWRIAPYLTPLLPHDKDYLGLRHVVPNNDNGLLLDVGANNGISSLGFRKVGIPYKILAIEANGYHEPSLRRIKRRINQFDYQILGAGATQAT